MNLYPFLSGAVALGYGVCALFFLRIWYRARDYLFLAFAGAFALLGTGQSVLSLSNVPVEERTHFFLFRLAAYSLIAFAIFRKNRDSRA